MVLHNNKWDRKAKRAYLRKHNIPPPGRPEPEADDEATEVPLSSNAWRYASSDSEEEAEGVEGSAQNTETLVSESGEVLTTSINLQDIIDTKSEIGESSSQKGKKKEEDDSYYRDLVFQKVKAPEKKKSSNVETIKDKESFLSLQKKIDEKKAHDQLKKRFETRASKYDGKLVREPALDVDSFLSELSIDDVGKPESNKSENMITGGNDSPITTNKKLPGSAVPPAFESLKKQVESSQDWLDSLLK